MPRCGTGAGIFSFPQMFTGVSLGQALCWVLGWWWAWQVHGACHLMEREVRGSTLEADQLGLNPSSATYQRDLESYSSSLSFTFLICKMGIDIAPGTQGIYVNLKGHMMLGGAQ